ncbi:restriction endonuclease subunit S [Agathobacter rectalis]|uniref:Restriction endonuclease subunit S n=1 Tax=Agathobacter rectalis TaxID=39491 RepID=A0A6L5TB18_9FIRM|nr:restriction endonuclease subunit S [Agathobacter rectalis]MSC60968.1 restriction endonuclease subunit S [Agathobacter rectalis]
MENPKIRFKGFTKDWEQRRFGEITELKSASRVHKDEWTSNGVPFYRSSDVMTAINGTENEKAFISEELYEKLSKVSGKLEEGDILVTGGGSVGNPYIVPDNKPLYTKDADLLWIKNKGKFHPYFLYEFFFSPTFRNYLGSISHVGTIAHYTITQLSDTPIGLPIFEEQKEVGEYFQSLDRLITLHQRKCDQTKNLKKYMLQKMFPQNGAKVPEIRFDGYTYDWEQRKLGEVLISLQNNTLSRADLSNETGIAKNVHYGDVLIKFGDVLDVSREQLPMIKDEKILDKYKASFLQNGDVIIADTAEDTTVGKCSEIAGLRDEVVLSGLHTIPYRPVEKFATGYLGYYLNASAYHDQLIPLMQGIKVTSISKYAMQDTDIVYPKSIEEQAMIGSYFQSLDHLITLHQRKCDELKKMKKYMLQNMFI